MKANTNIIYPFLALFACACFTLLPSALAVTPAPDGGYPNGNTAEGQNALLSLTSGTLNTAVGFLSLKSDSTGGGNTAIGAGALLANTADQNTATGVAALLTNTTGMQNTASGALALLSNTTGSFNTANGTFALFSNTTGTYNTAIGYQALFANSTGGFNTASGDYALGGNTTGTLNTAIGYQALFGNSTGTQNTATGYAALARSTADSNTACGFAALAFTTTGFDNTATGTESLQFNTSGTFNTAIGNQALQNITTGLNNVALGDSAGLNHTGDDGQNIDIGNLGVAGDNRTTRIGASQLRTFIAGIYGATASGGTPVYVNSDGQLGTITSSRRFKDNINAMEQASETILSLKPVTFRYKKEIDPAGTAQFGLVAEEVEQVNPDLVVRDKEGKPYTVRYDAVNAMLLNEFLKEHKKTEKLEATVASLVATVKEQASQIQKVSAQLELGKPTAQTVLNNH
jgi:Chaperone of endosialidase